MHALIVGGRGVGKSTLIRRVLSELKMPVWGFETKKEESCGNDAPGDPVYIYEAGKPRVKSPENLVGRCENACFEINTQAFERFAPKLMKGAPGGHIALMDEIGIMESSSESFCGAVMAVLDGSVPAIAAVKDKDRPFLEKVRKHPKCRVFRITTENREELFAEVLEFMKEQIKNA